MTEFAVNVKYIKKTAEQ